MDKYQKERPETIRAMFDTIAKQYDRANSILSFNLHKSWNSRLTSSVLQNNSCTLLDLCSGTGEIAFNYLKKTEHPCRIYLMDFSPEMLECAKKKAKKLKLESHTLSYLVGDVQQIPLLEGEIDCATIAYGIRNVQNPKKCFEEVLRVLKPGGHFAILELTQPENPLLKFGHQIYLKGVLPLLGKWFTSDGDAYRYLCNSIQQFIKPKELKTLLTEVGFHDVKSIPLLGGVATLFKAKKGHLWQ